MVENLFKGLFFFWCITLFLFALFHIAERFSPAQRGHSYRTMLATNGKIALVYTLLAPIAQFAGQFIAGYFFSAVARQLGAPWFSIPSNGVFIILAAFMPLLASDFFYYWFHRFQHTNRWLWEQHKLHHTDHSLNVTTSLRINWIEEFLRAFFIAMPMAIVDYAVTPKPLISTAPLGLTREIPMSRSALKPTMLF
jgi:sterol desaturase/sphingolipid hydroxylase (fatty acid hydroxylase superfamily)